MFMRKKFMITAKGLFWIAFLCCGAWIFPSEAKVYLAEPLLIEQPFYAGMRFYVYKPYGMPPNWYATFDGYPVIRNRDGVWVYGTYSGPNLIPTHYIVGSVVPAMAGLSPYTTEVQVSSVRTLPYPFPSSGSGGKEAPISARQPAKPKPVTDSHSTYMPDWLFDERFLALGRWKGSVDRIGILSKLGAPVAWSGNSPKVIYAWNGQGWYQMMAREGQRPEAILKDNIYALTRQIKHNKFVWYEADIPVLSQQAAVWGYYWMGELMFR
jgi:hypothetical protein